MIAIERRGWRIRIRRVQRSLYWLNHQMCREQRAAERNLELHAVRSEASKRGWRTRKARAGGNGDVETRTESTT